MTPPDTASIRDNPHSRIDLAHMGDEPPALIEVDSVRREFSAGDETVVALNDVSLKIRAGEMVAIVGSSGSGKSTLMNILGCLDRPTNGAYRVAGRDTRDMEPDELAALRREYFGFIFQRYHLLGDLTAVGNVEMPAVYKGREASARRGAAIELLERLGLGDRMEHRPSQLSGGQQQRVSIARALMNGGRIILADEPTGALDTKTGEDVMKILRDLHAEGHTIILVTHDMEVAEHADRIIELRDGEIISDVTKAETPATAHVQPTAPTQGALSAFADRFREAFRMATLAMMAHKMRTFLTMLGIVIGIASVVSVVALGEGSRQQVLANISSLGTNRIDIMPGTGFGDRRSSAVQTLTTGDAEAIATQDYVDGATPVISTSVTLRRGAVEASASVQGVGAQYFDVRGMTLTEGTLFTSVHVAATAQVVVVDPDTVDTLFVDGADPIGQVVLVGGMPATVIGVAEAASTGFGSDSLNVYAPYTSVMTRLLGDDNVRSISVRVKDDTSMEAAEAALTSFLIERHGAQDFYLRNTDEIRQTIEDTTGAMTLLIASIAVISLIVGGIGVMNIMLVSVTERIREIGVRMAVGARRSDIMQQFLIEAVLVCLLGGVIGVGLALGVGVIFSVAGSSFELIYSLTSIIAAFACASLIGIGFGFLPARSASRLDPINALARD